MVLFLLLEFDQWDSHKIPPRYLSKVLAESSVKSRKVSWSRKKWKEICIKELGGRAD